MKLSMRTMLNAVLLTTVAVPVLSLSAFAQQEVDPTYYDPWAPSIKVVARATEKPTATGKLRKVSSASDARPKSKKQTRTAAVSHSESTQTMASARTPR